MARKSSIGDENTKRTAPSQYLSYILIPGDTRYKSYMRGSHDRLRWAREAAGYPTAADFAAKHNLELGTYRHHENGTRGLRPHVAKKYANLLNVDTNWLQFGVGSPRKGVDLTPELRPISWAPLISWVQAGQLLATDNEVRLTGEEEYVPVVWHHPTYALEVRGTSMNRVAQPGDIIIVDPEDREPKDKLIYIVRNGSDLTFKRYRDSNGPIRLEPDSTENHETIFPSDGLEVVGRVIFVLRKA